jgi:hypothetical protein
MREVITFRNLKERDCATVAERCRVLPPHTSLRVLLGYVVITWSRNSKAGRRDLSDVTRNNTQRCVLRVSDSSVDRRDWRQCSASKVLVVKWSTSRLWAVKYEFAVSYRRELRRLFLWIEDLCGIFEECKTYSCASRSVARRRLVEQENPSACAAVNFNWCKWETALYYHCISVIYEWVRKHLIINSIIRTRTRLISALHVTILYFNTCRIQICASKAKLRVYKLQSVNSRRDVNNLGQRKRLNNWSPGTRDSLGAISATRLSNGSLMWNSYISSVQIRWRYLSTYFYRLLRTVAIFTIDARYSLLPLFLHFKLS